MVVWYLDICEWYWQGLDGGDGAGALHCIVLFYVVMVQAWMVVMVLVRFSLSCCSLWWGRLYKLVLLKVTSCGKIMIVMVCCIEESWVGLFVIRGLVA